MGTYRDQGIVLRTHRLGETDRILNLLTQGRGKVRAVAKGVRRPGSRFGARLEPFSHVDLQLYEGRNLDIVNQAELIESHTAVREDWVRSAAGSVMVELVDQVAQEGARDNRLFQLLRSGLQALDAGPDDPSIFVDAFLLRAAAAIGFATFTEACASCRRPGEHVYLSVKGGGVLCADCSPPGTRAVERRVVELVALLGAPAQWTSLPGIASEDARQVASSYVRAFVEHHLDRRLRSYDALPRP